MKVGVTITNDKGVDEFEAIIFEKDQKLSFMFIKMNTYYYERILKAYEKIEKYNPVYLEKDLVLLLEFFIYNGLDLKYKILSEEDALL